MTATPPATPHLLETYGDARLLMAAKGWGLEKGGREVASKPGMKKRYGLSQSTFSKKTKPGLKVPIEPEVAAVVENLKTWHGYERQAEIVTRGLLALHRAASGEDGGAQGENEAAPMEDAAKVLKELREALPGELIDALEEKASARDGKLVEVLEAKAGARDERLVQKVEGLGRFSWKHAFSSGVGAILGCLVLVPVLLIGRTAISAGTHGGTIPPHGRDTSSRWFEPETQLPDPPIIVAEWGEKRPLDQTVPFETLPGQKVAPCNERWGEVAINGNCWANMGDVKPPCDAALFRHGD